MAQLSLILATDLILQVTVRRMRSLSLAFDDSEFSVEAGQKTGTRVHVGPQLFRLELKQVQLFLGHK